MLQARFKLPLPLLAPQLTVLTTKPLLWHKDTFRATSRCLKPHWLISDVQFGLWNVASQIQTSTAYISTTVKTTKPQLWHANTFWAVFGSLNGFYLRSSYLFELLNAGRSQQRTPTDKPQGVTELLRFLFPPSLCCWLSLREWHHAFKRSDHTSFIHRPPWFFMPCWRGRSYMGCGQATTAVVLFRQPVCSLWRACVERAKSVFSNSGWTPSDPRARLCGELLSLALSRRPVIHVCPSWETGSRCRKKAPVWSRSPC